MRAIQLKLVPFI